MKFKFPALPSLFWPGALVVVLSLLVVGCEPISTSEGDGTQAPISMAELNGVPLEPEPEPTDTETESESSTTAEPSITPTPTPTPAPIVSSGGFLWQPRTDSVRIVIPASLAHWQLHVFSRRRHYTLYGPDNRGGNQPVNVEYILPGGGATWRQKSSSVGDDGTLMVFINTRDVATGSRKNAGWRIMNPEQPQSGDGGRLLPGENRAAMELSAIGQTDNWNRAGRANISDPGLLQKEDNR
jgi:hypothetical protein